MLEAVFWASVGLILYTHAGYPLLLWLLARDQQHVLARPRDRRAEECADAAGAQNRDRGVTVHLVGL